MMGSPASFDEELAALKRAVVALESKIGRGTVAPTHPAGSDGAFKLLVLADELKNFGHRPKRESKWAISTL
jgi:hypothetical protein